MNSLIVSLATVVITVVVSLFAGYGFSRYRFPLKNVLFVLLMATLMIPFQSILTPLFIMLAKLGLNNSLVGLVLVYVTLQLPFSVFMMRNAFDAVPKEIEEAARVDGVRDLRLLTRVLLPLVMPVWRRWQSLPSSMRGTSSSQPSSSFPATTNTRCLY